MDVVEYARTPAPSNALSFVPFVPFPFLMFVSTQNINKSTNTSHYTLGTEKKNENKKKKIRGKNENGIKWGKNVENKR